MSDIERGIVMVILALVFVLLLRITWNAVTIRLAEWKKETLLKQPHGPELFVRLQKPTSEKSGVTLLLGDLKDFEKKNHGELLFFAIIAASWFFVVGKIVTTEPFMLELALVIIGVISSILYVPLLVIFYFHTYRDLRQFLRRRVRERAGFPLSPWGKDDHPELRPGEVWLTNSRRDAVGWKSARVGDIPYDINAQPLTEEVRKRNRPIFVQLSEIKKTGVGRPPAPSFLRAVCRSFFRTSDVWTR